MRYAVTGIIAIRRYLLCLKIVIVCEQNWEENGVYRIEKARREGYGFVVDRDASGGA